MTKEQMAQLVRDGETGTPLRQGGIDQQDSPAPSEEEEGPEGTAGLSVDLDPQPAADHPEVDRGGLHQGERRVQKRLYGVVSEWHGFPTRHGNRAKNSRRRDVP